MRPESKQKLRLIAIDPVDEYLIDGLLKSNIIVDYKPHMPKHELLEVIDGYDLLLGRNRMAIDTTLIQRGKKLRMIIRAGTGIENIDTEELKKKGIVLVNAPGSAVESVAELAICLMLMASRDVFNDIDSLKNGVFRKEKGKELQGKTLGILGFGSIGSRVAELAKSFNINVIASDVRDLSEKAKNMGVDFVGFNELFSKSDIISVNLSMEGNTKPMIDASAFRLMKNGVIIVNTARAEAVDMNELVKEIKNDKIGFYATDVLWHEPPKDETELELLKNKKFIATSHIGAQTREAQRRVAEATLKNIIKELNKMNI